MSTKGDNSCKSIKDVICGIVSRLGVVKYQLTTSNILIHNKENPMELMMDCGKELEILALKAKSPYDQMWKALLAHLQLIIHKYAKPLVYHLSEPDCLTELSSLINHLLNILKQL